jgi:hypothetical protein
MGLPVFAHKLHACKWNFDLHLGFEMMYTVQYIVQVKLLHAALIVPGVYGSPGVTHLVTLVYCSDFDLVMHNPSSQNIILS